MPENRDKIKLHERVAIVETLLTEIKDNHLHTLENKVNWLLALIITTLVSVVLSLLI